MTAQIDSAAPSSADTAGGPSATTGSPAPFPIASETDLPLVIPRVASRQVDHLPAGVSRTDLAKRIRAERRNTYDEATHWGARALRTYSFIGCGFFLTFGLTAVSQTGFATVGKVYLVAAAAFALVFILNLGRLYNQERLYDNRRRLDSELARAVAAALAEGDDLTVREAAAA